MVVIRGWAFLLFLGAADCELMCSSRFEKANSGYYCSHDDPPRMGNVWSVEANPRHSPYDVFTGDRLFHRHRCRPERSKEPVRYVDVG